jgi:transcriptional regulator with XRE-family HTH domain
MGAWYETLRQLRASSSLTQKEAAARAGIAPETISRLERGETLRPATSSLLALLSVFGASDDVARAIFAEIGADPAVTAAGSADVDAFAAALQAIRAYSWPCLLLNERLEVAAFNPVASAAEFARIAGAARAGSRSLVRLIATPAAVQHFANWEDLVAALAAAALAHGIVLGSERSGSRYLATLDQQVQASHSGVHTRLQAIWRRAHAEEGRSVLPIAWLASDGALLRYDAVLSPWSAAEGLWVLDCHPADASTAAWLLAHQPLSERSQPDPTEPWHKLLQGARRAVGLTQRDLVAALGGGAALASLVSYESGRRRPRRDLLLRLARLLEIDLLTRNRILRGLGEPLPVAPPDQSAAAFQRSGVARPALQAKVAAQRWPCLVVDVAQRCRIVASNTAFEALYGEHLPENLIALILGRRFQQRALNWDEVAGAVVPSALKQALASDATTLPDWLRRVLTAVHRADAGLLPRLRVLFAGAVAAQPAGRAVTPLLWRPDQGEPLSFSCVVSRWSAGSTLWALDLYPADGETWQRLTGEM